jgi:hypothetical protein
MAISASKLLYPDAVFLEYHKSVQNNFTEVSIENEIRVHRVFGKDVVFRSDVAVST